jgi:tetratricopeptide (TPR) repeat protein
VALFDLSRLFAVNHDSPEYNNRNHQGVLYAQSWALIHMLHMDERYEAKYWDFFAQVANGRSSAEALMAVYGKTPEYVARDLVNYINRSQFSARATNEKKKVAANTKFDTRAVEAFEGALVTANLRADSPDGEQDARAAYQTLEKERPNDLPLLESRAYFELRRGTRAAALPYFERAVAEGSRNVKLIYDYARLDSSKTAVLLPKALELAPDDIDIRLDNARLLLNERKGSQTVIALSKMDGLSREQAFKRFQLLANAYLLLNQPQDARGAATLAGRNADSDDRREYAARLLNSIDEYAAQLAQYEERVKAATAANTTAPGNATSPGDALRAGASAGISASSDGPPVPRISMEMIRPPVLTDNRPSDAAGVILMEGRLRNIICLPEGKGLVLEMVSGKTSLRLLIDRPEMVLVRGRADGTVDLRCEAQDQALTVGFVPGVNMTHQTEGHVRVLNYGK